MKAFILAGGLGTRLSPLTDSRPKSLLPFANTPLAKHTIGLLRQQGVCDFVFLLHYLPEEFPKLLGDGSSLGSRITYVAIPQDLDTAGCIKFVEKQIDQTSLIFSGDIIVDFDLHTMLVWHRQRDAQITIAIRTEPLPVGYGVVQLTANGRIIRFQEKPTQAELFSNWMNCGIYLVEPGILKNFSAHRPLSFEREIFPFFAERRKAIFGFPLVGYWRDIGKPADYLKAHADFLARKLPAAYYQNVQPAESASVGGGNIIGTQVFIDSGCTFQHCFIGDGCVIERGAEVHETVLWDGVQVCRGAKLRDCVVGSGARIGADAEILSLSLLAAGCEVPPRARVGPNARLTGTECTATDSSLLTKAVA